MRRRRSTEPPRERRAIAATTPWISARCAGARGHSSAICQNAGSESSTPRRDSRRRPPRRATDRAARSPPHGGVGVLDAHQKTILHGMSVQHRRQAATPRRQHAPHVVAEGSRDAAVQPSAGPPRESASAVGKEGLSKNRPRSRRAVDHVAAVERGAAAVAPNTSLVGVATPVRLLGAAIEVAEAARELDPGRVEAGRADRPPSGPRRSSLPHKVPSGRGCAARVASVARKAASRTTSGLSVSTHCPRWPRSPGSALPRSRRWRCWRSPADHGCRRAIARLSSREALSTTTTSPGGAVCRQRVEAAPGTRRCRR